jgi:hypothetical protein
MSQFHRQVIRVLDSQDQFIVESGKRGPQCDGWGNKEVVV